VYGDDIYQTQGSHRGYLAQCKELVKKLGANEFVNFMGLENPEKIFSENEVILHSSIRPEPFGRVLIEAFSADTLVISTGLGGAAELLEKGHNGVIVYPYDSLSLLGSLRQLSQDETFRLKLLSNAKTFAEKLNSNTRKQISELVSECQERNNDMEKRGAIA